MPDQEGPLQGMRSPKPSSLYLLWERKDSILYESVHPPAGFFTTVIYALLSKKRELTCPFSIVPPLSGLQFRSKHVTAINASSLPVWSLNMGFAIQPLCNQVPSFVILGLRKEPLFGKKESAWP